MNEPRYMATDNLRAELKRQDRSIRWLWRRAKDAGETLTDTYAWYVCTGRNTASESLARTIATILGVSVESIFTTVDKDVRTKREAA